MGQGGGRMGLRGARRLALASSTAGLFAAALSTAALAGTFEMTWGTPPFDWPAGLIGSQTYTMTDERGFELDVTITIAAFGGTRFRNANGVPIYPDDVAFFGNDPTLGLIYDAGAGNSGVGESTMSASMTLTSGGVPFPTNGIVFEVSDIDSVDNNGATDRCDFVTVTGNAGNPVLAPVGTGAGVSVRIGGPGVNGSGATGPLAANQAQCIYNLGGTGSPNSAGDDNGTILATFPDGTSVATVAYDESIENVLGQTNRNAAARGIGAFAAVAVTNDDDGTIALSKTADRERFAAAGETITYTYRITNNGRLPINTGQDIDVEDNVIGTVQCPFTADIPPGGFIDCTATHVVTAQEASDGLVENLAVAGVGLPGQPFSQRLQSNQADESVVADDPAATIDKRRTTGPTPVTAAGQVLGYTITVANTGNVPLTSPVLGDTLPDGSQGTAALQSGDADGDNEIDVGETWTYAISYTVTQADMDAGAPLVNRARFDASELPATIRNDAATTVAPDPGIEIVKAVTPQAAVGAGDELTYTYDVTNTGNQTLTDVSVADVHNGFGAAPVPGFESLRFDNGAPGDSTDAAVDGTWDRLAPLDTVRFTGTYTVVQRDVDELQ